MPTPRDFVKQDSTLTMQQHCEIFMDTLAAKGATDTVFLFEELLETFPVGRATAILILGDWQEKRAAQCQHEQLARQCLLCEHAAENERLRTIVDKYTKLLMLVTDVCPGETRHETAARLLQQRQEFNSAQEAKEE